MFGLKIFLRVQTFRRVPPVLPRNFCHPDHHHHHHHAKCLASTIITAHQEKNGAISQIQLLSHCELSKSSTTTNNHNCSPREEWGSPVWVSGRPRESILCPAKSILNVEIKIKVRIKVKLWAPSFKTNINIRSKWRSKRLQILPWKIGLMLLKINIMQNYDDKRSPSKNSMTNCCSTSVCDVFTVSDKRFGTWQQSFLLWLSHFGLVIGALIMIQSLWRRCTSKMC